MTDQPMPRAPKTWVVKTRDGADLQITAATHSVSQAGHLHFDNGVSFNRGEWRYVLPNPTP